MRSWRYAATINDGVVEHWFEEPESLNNFSDDDDPYTVSLFKNMYYRIPNVLGCTNV